MVNDEENVQMPFLNQNNKHGHRKTLIGVSLAAVIFTIVVLMLVLFIPVFQTTNTIALNVLQSIYKKHCFDNKCRMHLVESIPEGMVYSSNLPLQDSTHNAWLKLINDAQNSIDIASFYWTLRKNEIYTHNSSLKGEEIFQALFSAGVYRNVKVKIVQNAPSGNDSNKDTEFLKIMNASEVSSVDFSKLFNDGVLHSKFWVIDKKDFYIGSADMDWRALTQNKELGIIGYDCPCLAEDILKIFETYRNVSLKTPKIPPEWPKAFHTEYNINNPMKININGENLSTFISGSPPLLNPWGRTDDADAIVNVILSAKKFIYISLMEYYPSTIYSKKKMYWSVIDDAIKKAAFDNHVSVKMLINMWNHTDSEKIHYLESLVKIAEFHPNADLEVKRFVIPATSEQANIPSARLSHNKFMVTDNTAYVGTSDWSADFFINTAGVGIVINETLSENTQNRTTSIRKRLQDVFERDWNSPYVGEITKPAPLPSPAEIFVKGGVTVINADLLLHCICAFIMLIKFF